MRLQIRHLCACLALLACPPLLDAQDTTPERSQADFVREADSVRIAYADSASQAGIPNEPAAQPETAEAPAAPSSTPARTELLRRDQTGVTEIQHAITRGQKAKENEGVRGGSATLMKQGRGFDVTLMGPMNRVANAARAATGKYLPFTMDSVSSALARPAVIVTAYPRKPQLMSGSWKETAPATHLVLRPKDAAKGAVLQPASITTFAETWGNAFGGKFEGQGVRAEFPASSIPSGESDVLIITASNEYKIGIKAKERGRLR